MRNGRHVLQKSFRSPSEFRIAKLQWVGHIARKGETRSSYESSVDEPVEKR